MQKSRARWDDLRIFLAVARQGRLAAAGRSLDLDAATIGRRIGELEESLACVLFERSPGGYALTEAGRALLPFARTMRSQAGQSHAGQGEAAREIADPLSGRIRIGAPDGVIHYLLIEGCDALSAANPDLTIEVVALHRTFPLARGEADVAISLAPPSSERLTVRKVADYQSQLYLRRDRLDALGTVRGLDDLRGLRGIGYVPDMIPDREFDDYALLGRESEPELSSNSLLTQLRWCRAGAGLCMLPDFVARAHPELCVVLPREIALTRSFYLIRHQDDARDARVNRVADMVAGYMRAALVNGLT